MSETNKQTVRRIFEEFTNAGRMDLAPELYAPTFQAPLVDVPGPEGAVALHHVFRSAFRDIHDEIVTMVAEGDTVMSHIRVTGVQVKPWFGYAPTDARLTWDFVAIDTLMDGKLAARTAVIDFLSPLMQAGHLPPFPGPIF